MHSSTLKHLSVIAKIPAVTPQASQIFLTGNQPELGEWNPRGIELQPIGQGICQAKLTLPASITELQFKITRGSWNQEAADSLGHPCPNHRLHLAAEDTEIVLNLVNWKDLGPMGATGDLRVFPDFFSPQLENSRSLRVWLPPSYAAHRTRHYPVIYAHDGQNLFDPRTSGSGVEWNVDEVLTTLIHEEKTEEAIVVGVDCTQDRFSEYNYLVRGQLYTQFLIETIKPFIDGLFRTIPDRDHTFAMGSSMGGLISFALAWRHPEVFSRIAALSLPAAIENGAIYRIMEPVSSPAEPVSLYIDYGDYLGDASYPQPGREFIQHLLGTGFPAYRLEHREFHYADHFEADWARRVEIPLQFLLNYSSSL